MVVINMDYEIFDLLIIVNCSSLIYYDVCLSIGIMFD